MTLSYRPALLIVLLIAGACASPNQPARQAPRGSAAISAEEIRSSQATTAYDAVQLLRPSWLRQRGQSSLRRTTDLAIYVDNARLGGVGSLRDVPASTIVSVQFISGIEATQRWGTDHGVGAIVVQTGRKPGP